MPKPRTEKTVPVDTEDDDRRAPSVQQDEHRGLAGRLLDLRTLVEDNRKAAVRDFSQLNQRMATLESLVSTIAARVDREVESIQGQQRDLAAALREGGEQVRVAGELGRKMTDQVKVLEELREMASDPHEVIKPIQRGLAHLRGDLETLAKTIDIRFEQYPRPRGEPVETRDASEDPIVKMGNLVRDLKNRIVKLEAEAD